MLQYVQLVPGNHENTIQKNHTKIFAKAST